MPIVNNALPANLGDSARILLRWDLLHLPVQDKELLVSAVLNLDIHDHRIDYIIGATTQAQIDQELHELGFLSEEDMNAMAMTRDLEVMAIPHLAERAEEEDLTLARPLTLTTLPDVRGNFFANDVCEKAMRFLKSKQPHLDTPQPHWKGSLAPLDGAVAFRFRRYRRSPDGTILPGPGLPQLVNVPTEIGALIAKHAIRDPDNKGERKTIYLFSEHYPATTPTNWVLRKCREPPYLHVSKAARLEAMPEYYGSQKFVVCIPPVDLEPDFVDNIHALDFLEPIAKYVKDLIIYARFGYCEDVSHENGTTVLHGGTGVVRITLQEHKYRVKVFLEGNDDDRQDRTVLTCCDRSSIGQVWKAWFEVAEMLEMVMRRVQREVEMAGDEEIVFIGCGSKSPYGPVDDMRALVEGRA